MTFTDLHLDQNIEKAIKKYFLENTHKVRVTLAPDPELEQKTMETEKKRLKEIQSSLTPNDYEEIVKDAMELARRQQEDEDISCLPTLEIIDIPLDINLVNPPETMDDPALDIYTQPTSGILYFTAAAGIPAINEDLLPMLPFFCHAMTMTGTMAYDYVELARLMDEHTGGMGFSISAGTRFSDPNGGCLPMLTFSGKCLSRKIDDMFAIFTSLLTDSQFTGIYHKVFYAYLFCQFLCLFEFKVRIGFRPYRNSHRVVFKNVITYFSNKCAVHTT